MARSTSTARRYAEAAFQLASRDGTLDAWAEGLDLAARTTADERVLRQVDSPARPYADRVKTLEQLLGGRVPEGVVRLAVLLARRGGVERLGAVSAEYRRLLDAERGVVQARVTSAAPLSARVDESLIGGLTVGVGDTLLDASVRGRLERLRNDLVAGTRSR